MNRKYRLTLIVIIQIATLGAFAQNIMYVESKIPKIPSNDKNAAININKELKDELAKTLGLSLKWAKTSDYTDWFNKSDKGKKDYLRDNKINYVLKLDKLERINNNFKIKFKFQKIDSTYNSKPVTWVNSDYYIIMDGSSPFNESVIAKKVTGEIKYYLATGKFRPRIKLEDFTVQDGIEEIIIEDFKEWLIEELDDKTDQKERVDFIIYDISKHYPAHPEYHIDGKFISHEKPNDNLVEVVIYIYLMDEERRKKVDEIIIDVGSNFSSKNGKDLVDEIVRVLDEKYKKK